MDALLNVEGINVYYGAIHAIKDISFYVKEGEVVTLIGANGAGKTTTLQTVSGLLRSKTGSITFEGHNISSVRADKLGPTAWLRCPRGAGSSCRCRWRKIWRWGLSPSPHPAWGRTWKWSMTSFPG